MKVFRSVILEQ